MRALVAQIHTNGARSCNNSVPTGCLFSSGLAKLKLAIYVNWCEVKHVLWHGGLDVAAVVDHPVCNVLS